MGHMKAGNLFVDSEAPSEGERFETLLAHKNLVIERIVSSTNAIPSEYVQAHDEWVAMLRGQATLELAGRIVALQPGDYLFIPAGTPHTVRSAADGALWLAIHLQSGAPNG